jgi:hypothetical protein
VRLAVYRDVDHGTILAPQYGGSLLARPDESS